MRSFIGTWSIVSYHATSADGMVVHPMGKDLSGRISYDGAGRMAVQLQRNGRAPFSTPDLFAVPADEALEAMSGYIAYYGTYEVDEAAGTVTHRVEVSSVPNWVGTEQVRHFALAGDRLTLSTDPMLIDGVEVTNVLEWRREEP